MLSSRWTFGLLSAGLIGVVIWWSRLPGVPVKQVVIMSTARRTPAFIRKHGNQLKGQRSAYLQQHAHNPIDWYPWGEAALQRAKRLKRPIFLSIGYASCHWCHVMEKNVFEDDAVARYMNQHFVCIKVDREERPDLDAVYMEAVQAMTGSGGWPMSVFLTPGLKPFYGGTYIPRERFIILAKRVVTLFSTERDKLDQRAMALQRMIAASVSLSQTKPLDHAAYARMVDEAFASFDRRWGGSQGRMKFPTPARWSWLLHRLRKTGDVRINQMVRKTLDSMGSGGINDQLAGGFHRYTVEPTWVVPHFEKMLYDNAQLASLYLEAAAYFSDARYGEIAKQTLDFLIRDMSDHRRGGFFASFDADSGGQEGSYYVWTLKEIEGLAGAADGPALGALLGVTKAGNFEGKSILTLRADLKALSASTLRPEQELAQLLPRHRAVLLAARRKRVAPGLDKKIITAWNGLAIRALAAGYRYLHHTRYRRAAEKAASLLWRAHRDGKTGRLYRASNQGVAKGEAVLDDYAFFAEGLLELFVATQDLKHLRRAKALLAVVSRDFAHPQGAGFYFTPKGHEAPLGRQVRSFDSVRPSGLGVTLRAMLKLAALTADEELRGRVRRIVAAYGDRMRQAKLAMATLVDVAQLGDGPLYEVVIAGDPGAPTEALRAAVEARQSGHALLISVPAAGPSPALQKALPSTEGKLARGGRATAYVCRFGACKRPARDARTLQRQLAEGWAGDSKMTSK